MKCYLILILFSIIPITGLCQFQQSIDIIGGFEYSYRHLRNLGSEAFSSSIDNLNAMSMPKSNWRFGFNYNYRLNQKLTFKTGIRYASIGYISDVSKQIWGPHYEYPPIFYSDLHFIEIPLVARLAINENRFSPFFELGISPSLYVNSRSKKIVNTNRGTTTTITNKNHSGEGFNEVHLVGFISLGLNYRITDQFQLFGQPAFRYHLTRINPDGIANHLYNYGFEIGLRKKLK